MDRARPTGRWSAPAFYGGGVLVALGLTALILIATGAPPLAAFANIARGAVGSAQVFSDVLVSWIPLLIATSGLLVTFKAGLWNIGIEGQIMLGGIFTTWTLRTLGAGDLNPALVLGLSIIAGMAGGMMWALFAGALKTAGGVNEIFGGLGLNFVATALNLWLIFGPWKRPGIASMSGTEPFRQALWMPTVSQTSRLALAALILAIVAILVVYLLIERTRFGLRLRAVGKNSQAAYLLGVPTRRYLLYSFALCGLLAGLAGSLQVTAVYHRLIPSISSGYGYLGLMVAMLASYRAAIAAPVALFFAALNVGSIQLPIVLKLDSSLAGVIQGALVLFVLMAAGLRARLRSARTEAESRHD